MHDMQDRRQRSTRKSSTSKILGNNINFRVPMLKHLVKSSSSRDNSAFNKKEVCDSFNISTAPEGERNQGYAQEIKKNFFLIIIFYFFFFSNGCLILKILLLSYY